MITAMIFQSVQQLAVDDWFHCLFSVLPSRRLFHKSPVMIVYLWFHRLLFFLQGAVVRRALVMDQVPKPGLWVLEVS